MYLQQAGGAGAELVGRDVPLMEDRYPEPGMFGPLPASGFFVRQARNLEMSNVEIATAAADPRPAFWLQDVAGADFFRLKVPRDADAFALDRVSSFRSFGSQFLKDARYDDPVSKKL